MTSEYDEDARRAREELHERLRVGAKTRKSAETRRRIMETAEELIAERGNTVFKMSEVSRLCGMSKGALYYYFADKQDLVTAIFEDEVANLTAALDNAAAEGGTASETLRRLCDEFVNRVGKGRPLALAIVRELALSRDAESYEQNARVRHIVGLIAEQLERGKEEGVVRKDVDSHIAAVAACGAFTFAAVNASEMRNDISSLGLASELYDIVVRGLGLVA